MTATLGYEREKLLGERLSSLRGIGEGSRRVHTLSVGSEAAALEALLSRRLTEGNQPTLRANVEPTAELTRGTLTFNRVAG